MSDPGRPPLPLNYAGNLPHPRRRAVVTGIVCLAVLAAAGLGTAVVLPSFNRTRCEYPTILRCASNLRQIGQGIQMYANENGGTFPDDFSTLLLTQDLGPEQFICQETNDTRASGPTWQAVAADLEAGGHLSYVYVGKGLDMSASPDAVVAYEPLSNHGNYMNVLFADGRVERLNARDGRRLTEELAAGHNPPRAGGAR